MSAHHPLLPKSLSSALDVNGIELNSLQRAALDAALRGLDAIIHAETGSGKTLCFALPMLARLSTAAADGLQGIVLVPTLELAAQVARVLNTLQAGSAIALTPGVEQLPDSAPVLVGPPAMMLRLLSGGERGVDGAPRLPKASVRAMRTVVLDEADALMMPLGRYATAVDKERREAKPKEAAILLEQLCALCGEKLQVMAASATVGRPLRRMLATTCGGRTFEVIRDSGADAAEASETSAEALTNGAADDESDSRGVVGRRPIGLPSCVSVTVVTSEEDNVLAAVHDVIRAEGAAAPLLFIPPGRSLPTELQLLRQCSLDAVALDAAVLDSSAPLAAHGVAGRSAAASLSGGGSSSSSSSSSSSASVVVGAGKGPRVFVASPSGARGLDLPGIDLVIILGIPPSADALVHMAGRTGRQGQPGRVAILSTAKEADKKLALMSSQLARELGAERRHVAVREEVWAEMWRVHGKRYERNEDATPFYANRPRGRPRGRSAAGRTSGRSKSGRGESSTRKPKVGRGRASPSVPGASRADGSKESGGP
jgi:superfamily II DNA/RNA helicase